MSKIEQSVASDGGQPQPGFEPWLVVCLLGFVPGAIIVILPRATIAPYLVPICGSMIAFVLAGLVMLVRAEWKRLRESDTVP
jgi:4-amino-4-deoxy-L-arabinose transferase-like glycosyltransferase